MQFSLHTDYALRLLIHLSSIEEGLTSIAEVAEAQNISRTHLMKISNALARDGFIEALRGRNGGIKLARPPAKINLGDVVRSTENICGLIDCGNCRLTAICGLPSILKEASAAFQATLDRYNLADCISPPTAELTKSGFQ